MMPDFDPSTLDVQPAPHVTPDHTASTKDNRPLSRLFRGDARDKPRSNTRTPKARTTVPHSKPGEFVQPIADAYRAIGAVALPFDPSCAMVLLDVDGREFLDADQTVPNPSYGKDRAQICAEALDAAAQKSDGLRKFLQWVTTGGVWGAVIAAHAPIAVAIASHHTPFMEKISSMQMRAMQKSMERMEAQQNGKVHE